MPLSPEKRFSVESILDTFLDDASLLIEEVETPVLPAITEFIDNIVDLGGITLTTQQRLILRAFYGEPLDEEEQSILEFWKLNNNTTWEPVRTYQTLVLEAGRRSGKCQSFSSATITKENGLCYMHELVKGMPVAASSLIITGDMSLTEQGNLVRGLGLIEGEWSNINETIAVEGKSKEGQATKFFVKGVSATKKVVTQCGYSIEATSEHRVKGLDKNGNIVWRYFEDIEAGDILAVHRSTSLWPTKNVHVPRKMHHPNAHDLSEVIPTELSSDWAYLLGLLVGNGTWNVPERIELSLHEQDLATYQKALEVVGIAQYRTARDSRSTYGVRLTKCSTHLREFLDDIGYTLGSKVDAKKVPWIIRKSPKHIVAAFLSGLFDADGSVENKGRDITFSTASKPLSVELQLLLLNFGIVSHRKEKWIKGRPYYIMRLRGQKSVRKFINEIGFKLQRKNQQVVDNLNKVSRDGGDTERIPNQKEWLQKLRAALPSTRANLGINELTPRQEFRQIVGNAVKENNTEEFSAYRLPKLLEFARQHCQADPEAVQHFEYLADCDYFYDYVKTVEDSEAFCVDLSVPGPEQYVCQGFTNHNSLIASIITCFEFYCLCRLPSPQQHYGISTSSAIGILALATTADQAKRTIFREITGMISNTPYFKSLVAKGKLFIGKEEIAYEEKRLYLYSGNSKSASQVGATLKCLVMDEVARFQSAEGESNAMTLWSNLGVSGAPFKGKFKKIAISSAWEDGDAIEVLYNITKANPAALGVQACSWDLNPIHGARDNPIIVEAYLTDPILAATEFEGIRPATADAFLNKDEVVRAMQVEDVINASAMIVNEPMPLRALTINSIKPALGATSVVHIDPAVKKDAYAWAMGHAERRGERDIVIIDSVVAWEPTHNAPVKLSDVYDFTMQVNKIRPISKVSADHYSSAELVQKLIRVGIAAESIYFSNQVQLQMYSLVKQLLHEDRLLLPSTGSWAPLLIKELCKLRLVNGNKIDHPKATATGEQVGKDTADAIAGVVWELGKHWARYSQPPQPVKVMQPALRSDTTAKVISTINNSRRQWAAQHLNKKYY